MKVPNPPDSGKDIAEIKGVHREVESEGRWRQISGLTNRNYIRLDLRVRLQDKSKPSNCTESGYSKCGRYMERKKRVVPGEVSSVNGNRVRNS